MGSNPAVDIYFFHFEFLLPPHSEQVNGAIANEIKHDHSPEVIVIVDPRYKALYTVKSLYFVGAQFLWFSWIPSTTNSHPQRIRMYNKQKSKQSL